jgi:hypothetical protein
VNVCVAGTRTLSLEWQQTVYDFLASWQPDRVVSGGAKGPDSWALGWARVNLDPGMVKVYDPEWDTFGKAAGPKRTKWMLETEQPDLTLVLWDGDSPGTRYTLEFLRELGLDHVVVFTDGQTPDLVKQKFFAYRLA